MFIQQEQDRIARIKADDQRIIDEKIEKRRLEAVEQEDQFQEHQQVVKNTANKQRAEAKKARKIKLTQEKEEIERVRLDDIAKAKAMKNEKKSFILAKIKEKDRQDEELRFQKESDKTGVMEAKAALIWQRFALSLRNKVMLNLARGLVGQGHEDKDARADQQNDILKERSEKKMNRIVKKNKIDEVEQKLAVDRRQVFEEHRQHNLGMMDSQLLAFMQNYDSENKTFVDRYDGALRLVCQLRDLLSIEPVNSLDQLKYFHRNLHGVNEILKKEGATVADYFENDSRLLGDLALRLAELEERLYSEKAKKWMKLQELSFDLYSKK